MIFHAVQIVIVSLGWIVSVFLFLAWVIPRCLDQSAGLMGLCGVLCLRPGIATRSRLVMDKLIMVCI